MARKKRELQEINASSMADIAFLLLIFFLVTTTIDVDKGILTKLPPWSDEEPPPIELNDRNTLIVLINANDQLLVDGELTEVENLREKTKEFINNPSKNPSLAESTRKAVVSLQNDRGTSYGIYIEVQNELKAAYRELRDEYAESKYNKPYTELPSKSDEAKDVRETYPLRLSEAEPKEIGG